MSCRDARALFSDWKGGFYQHNKLANVYTAFELQRRWVTVKQDGQQIIGSQSHTGVVISRSAAVTCILVSLMHLGFPAQCVVAGTTAQCVRPAPPPAVSCP